MLVKEFLSSIEKAGMSVYPGDATHFLPTSVLAEHSIAVTNLWSAPAKYWREPELTLENKNLWQPDL